MKASTNGVLLNAELEHRELMKAAQLAEELGFEYFWYADERFYRETYVGLAACALMTSHIKLGPAVTDPYTRHPALTAAAMASLDELSAGRAVLGYGAGLSGFHNLGIKLDRPALALREGIHVIRRLWAGEETTYEGELVSIWNASMRFPTRADLPIYVAASSPYALRLAGEVGEGVIIPHCASPDILKPRLAEVHKGIQKTGRQLGPEVVARLDMSVSHDRDAALYQAKVRLGRLLWAQYPDVEYLGPHNLEMPGELERRLREAGPFQRTHDLSAFVRFADAIPDGFVYPISLAGTPDEVAAQAQAVLNAGADQIMAYPLVPPGESLASVMQLYATQVVPCLKRPAARVGSNTT
jgi:5,10-methylenetetrahydromethanopterin reductase